MDYIFKSKRVGFRRWQDSDIEPFYLLNSDAKAMEFFPKLLNRAENLRLVERIKQTFEAQGFCFYAVDLLQTGEFMGFVGFTRTSFEADFTPCVEIGWRLATQFWGQGIATEAAIACLQYGFERLGFEQVYSFTSVLNNRSERVMQKIGMERVKTFEHPVLAVGDRLRLHILYQIKKTDFIR